MSLSQHEADERNNNKMNRFLQVSGHYPSYRQQCNALAAAIDKRSTSQCSRAGQERSASLGQRWLERSIRSSLPPRIRVCLLCSAPLCTQLSCWPSAVTTQSLLLKSWTLKQEQSGRSDPRPAIHVTGEPFGRLLDESLRLLVKQLGADGQKREWQRHEFL